MHIIWIWSSLLLFDLVFTKENFIKAKIQTTFVFPNRPKDQRVMLGLLKVWARGLQYLNQAGFHIEGFLLPFCHGFFCCNRQSLCINYNQKLICEIQLLFALEVQSAEFFLMKKIYQCLWNMRQINLNFGGNSFLYGNFTCTGETKKSFRLWGGAILIAKNTILKRQHSVSWFRVDEDYFS